MNPIEKLLSKLASFPHSDTVGNPYVEQYAVDNLRYYFEYMLNQRGKRILLVGEAPGYKGCRITGIPFTSGRVVCEVQHPMLIDLKDKIHLPSVEAESTATIVWKYLAGINKTPLFWNSFPFHPHPEGISNKNRPPTNEEVIFGAEILSEIHQIYKPDFVAGIGHKGVSALERILPNQEIQYIRHPSNGGKPQFVEGMINVIS